ncbi:cytidyltransferase [Haematococcus lacustris]|uniref:Cytidyltransferase n=1 Tax=Haematococcus lacustris TaxID=44745 RepID=A0A699YXZ9_HAELA|nr:cytidyltransferase [Haematococcus lacustris]
MAVLWMGSPHTTYALTDLQRDWSLIKAAGAQAREAVLPDRQSFVNLAEAVNMSYQVQQGEGMQPLPDHGQLAAKYLGGGFGGYALYLFISQTQRDAFVEAQGGRGKDGAIAIEPYIRPAC